MGHDLLDEGSQHRCGDAGFERRGANRVLKGRIEARPVCESQTIELVAVCFLRGTELLPECLSFIRHVGTWKLDILAGGNAAVKAFQATGCFCRSDSGLGRLQLVPALCCGVSQAISIQVEYQGGGAACRAVHSLFYLIIS